MLKFHHQPHIYFVSLLCVSGQDNLKMQSRADELKDTKAVGTVSVLVHCADLIFEE